MMTQMTQDNMPNKSSSFISKVCGGTCGWIWRMLKLKKVYIPLIIIILVVGYFSFKNGDSSDRQIVDVQATTFVQEVAVTGKVESSQNVEMGFEASGRVAKVNYKVGDVVKAGDTIVSLANGDAYGTVLQRQADLDAEQAKLDETIKGSRAEDLAIAESDQKSAESTYNQNTQALIDKIKEAYSVCDDILRTKIDQLYTDPRSANPVIMSFDDYNLKKSLEDQRLRAGEMLTAWRSDTNGLTVSNYSLTYLDKVRANFTQMRTFLNDLGVAVSSFNTNGAISQTSLDKYRSDISAARTSFNAVVSGLTSAEQSYRTSLSAYDKAKETYNRAKNGSTPEQIRAQEARTKSARASLTSAQAVLAKTLIRAPFDGVVTKIDIKVGESASPNTAYVGLISATAYQIESYISESDIAKVKVGQPAKITLDAYGKDIVFSASVSEVDPAETILDGVSTYKIKLQFTQNDERVRSGMTANITIQTAEKPSSVVIPQTALFLKGGEKMVTVIEAGKEVERKVETGGLNTVGDIEVISGLMPGDKVLIKAK